MSEFAIATVAQACHFGSKNLERHIEIIPPNCLRTSSTEDESRFSIDNHFFKVFAKRLTSQGLRP
jgi:hypothetical protein